MKYKPTHTYELSPTLDNNHTTILRENPQNTESKADRLREIKQLFDEKILTEEEYEKEKMKILNEK